MAYCSAQQETFLLKKKSTIVGNEQDKKGDE
jgi:hypothetical protein